MLLAVLACVGLADMATSRAPMPAQIPTSPQPGSTALCTLGTGLDAGFEEIRNRPFDCGPDSYAKKDDRVWVKLRPHGALAQEGPLELQGDNLYLEGASVYARFADGSVRSAHYTPRDIVRTSRPKGNYALAVPAGPGPPEMVYAAIDRPWSATSVKLIKLVPSETAAARERLIIAMFGVLCGLAIVPLFYNIFFFWALRSPFLPWHSLMVLSATVYTFSSSGLIFLAFPEAGLLTRFWLNYWGPAVGTAAGAMFMIHYLEPHALSRTLRRAIAVAALVPILVTAVALCGGEWSRIDGRTWYHAAFLVPFGISMFALVQAVRNGSRSAWLLIAAWTPIFLLVLERLGRGLDLYKGFEVMDYGLYFALILETSIIAMGVAGRLVALRRAHDEAREREQTLVRLAETDGLTGLFNRRGFERRFAARHRRNEVHALALFDIDRFKQINDLYGHETGDRVLRLIGAICNDSRLDAARLGGDEFAILFKGSIEQASERLDLLRQRIAATLRLTDPLIAEPVTVSIGLVPVEPGQTEKVLLSLADQRLYGAKRAGRDQIMGCSQPASVAA